ncbi:hypothetical protein CKO28_08995 [Rhodovibrio sodomensis]|uniref:Uncharacterized protein n=1 Tax=Rhodovibrio sodomensis TaxID=1088 RepID=A0ABS1DCJ0_9PROT|nr:hypothetical protein [Rhodovibrio sodomensis]MBK1668172.1 hypothetical protein [Rhodovibrio sodomensis]
MFGRKDVTDNDMRAIRRIGGAIKDIYRINDTERSSLEFDTEAESLAEIDRVVEEQKQTLRKALRALEERPGVGNFGPSDRHTKMVLARVLSSAVVFRGESPEAGAMLEKDVQEVFEAWCTGQL